MVYMSDEAFIAEHKKLGKILRSGSQKERTKEAADQASELKSEVGKMAEKKSEEKAEKTEKGGIRRIEIEPAESGGFVVRVISKPKGGKGGEIEFGEPDLHVCANTEQLSSFLSGAFPAPTSRSKKGKSSSKSAGGSQVDTYEAEEGDNVS
jgi:hypothetical protein